MTIPANIRVNVGAPFPSQVKGAGIVAVAKANGIWTVSLNYAALGLSGALADPANSYALIYNALTGVPSLVQVGAIVNAGKSVITLNAAGPYAAQPNDDVILVNFTPMAITVNWAGRVKPLRVVDIKGNSDVNNITITPSLGQTQLTVVNGVYTIRNKGGSIILTPLPDGSGAY